MVNKENLNKLLIKKLNENKNKKDPLIFPILEAEEKTLSDLENEPKNEVGESIFEILDHCAERAEDFYDTIELKVERGVKVNKEVYTNTFNPLFLGPTGVGKTSMIKTWANERGYEVVTLNMMGDALDFLGVKTVSRNVDVQIDDNGNTEKRDRVTTVATKAFDKFLTGKTKILFLDEINKTNPKILQSLYDLISFHIVQNGDDVMFLPKLLFTVGAMNPSSYGNRDSLDSALKARMRVIKVDYDTDSWKKYMEKCLEEDILAYKGKLLDLKKTETSEDDPIFKKWVRRYEEACGRQEILNAIKKISWSTDAQIEDSMDDDEKNVLTPRTLEAAFKNCDGTKADFLKYVKAYCGADAWECMVEELKIYRDKQHIANEIWGKDYDVKEESEIKAEDNINVDNIEGQAEDFYSKLKSKHF